jgi:hypothetical protein
LRRRLLDRAPFAILDMRQSDPDGNLAQKEAGRWRGINDYLA